MDESQCLKSICTFVGALALGTSSCLLSKVSMECLIIHKATVDVEITIVLGRQVIIRKNHPRRHHMWNLIGKAFETEQTLAATASASEIAIQVSFCFSLMKRTENVVASLHNIFSSRRKKHSQTMGWKWKEAIKPTVELLNTSNHWVPMDTFNSLSQLKSHHMIEWNESNCPL